LNELAKRHVRRDELSEVPLNLIARVPELFGLTDATSNTRVGALGAGTCAERAVQAVMIPRIKMADQRMRLSIRR
jgi:hypothetical protein